MRDVSKILHSEGVFILEFADLKSIIKNNIFDTICHEHLEYYSVFVIKKMLKKHGLKIIDYKTNKINGGSSLFFISFENFKKKSLENKISEIIDKEIKLGLNNPKFYKKIFNNILKIGRSINIKLENEINKKKKLFMVMERPQKAMF